MFLAFPQELHQLILFMLRINPMERPFIYSVIEKAKDLIGMLESRVWIWAALQQQNTQTPPTFF